MCAFNLSVDSVCAPAQFATLFSPTVCFLFTFANRDPEHEPREIESMPNGIDANNKANPKITAPNRVLDVSLRYHETDHFDLSFRPKPTNFRRDKPTPISEL